MAKTILCGTAIIGIDASNIRSGGGVTHLIELLRAAKPSTHGFSKVIVWGGQNTLSRIEERPWLVKSHQPLLDKALPYRVFWQTILLSKLAHKADCSVVFLSGSSYAGSFRPFVTISQNLLPFEWRELRRYGLSVSTLRLILLRWIQSCTFRRADGLIFLTRYAQNSVMQVIKTTLGKTAIIPHGINDRFASPPREQLPINQYSVDRPFRILYVSIIDVYKHQWHVAEAVVQLRKSGLPVALELVGPAYPSALKRLRQTLDKIDPVGEVVRYSGEVPYAALHACYEQADLGLFASSCETFGMILTEAMSSGLPIACSSCSAMPELLGDAGVYFDPENPDDIAHALRTLINSADLRTRLAEASFERVKVFSWQRCADETFGFLARCAITKS
jgi:glycosyltransferase involved in cell wall biosynthesis